MIEFISAFVLTTGFLYFFIFWVEENERNQKGVKEKDS